MAICDYILAVQCGVGATLDTKCIRIHACMDSVDSVLASFVFIIFRIYVHCTVYSASSYDKWSSLYVVPCPLYTVLRTVYIYGVCIMN